MNPPIDYDFDETRIRIHGEYVPCPAGLGLEYTTKRVKPGDTMKCPCCEKLLALTSEDGLAFPVWKREWEINNP